MDNEIPDQSPQYWNPSQKIAFRFVFVLFSLFIILENNGTFPFWYLLEFLNDGISLIVPWVGKNILGISRHINTVPNGSGDTTRDYVLIFTIISLSTISCIVWSLLDGKRTNYVKLYYWLTVIVRYFLAFMLFNYGLIKIFKIQFPSPDIFRMSEPYGHSTPMGLAWTYFGYSSGYNWFVGIAELLSVLLLFRRTVTLGALITLMTALNIAAVNFCFDVPVKLISIFLIVMSLFLLWGNFRQLAAFFVLQKTVHLVKIEAPLIRRKWLRITKSVVKFSLVLYTISAAVYQISRERSRDEAPKPDWYGVYEINEVTHFSDTIQVPDPKTFPWKEVVMGRSNQVRVRMMNDSSCGYSIRILVSDTTMTFVPTDRRFKKNRHVFRYDMSDSINIRLTGNLNGDSVSFVLHKVADDESDFRLDSTEFHWISDKPNNR